jgi:hypothetical protein
MVQTPHAKIQQIVATLALVAPFSQDSGPWFNESENQITEWNELNMPHGLSAESMQQLADRSQHLGYGCCRGLPAGEDIQWPLKGTQHCGQY